MSDQLCMNCDYYGPLTINEIDIDSLCTLYSCVYFLNHRTASLHINSFVDPDYYKCHVL